MEFDFLNGRYIAVNQDNDIVCIYEKWLSSYKGDSEYPGNAIPLYSGTELYIKKEYIEMLEKQFGTLMMKTCVESYTAELLICKNCILYTTCAVGISMNI